jgi:hypothetical protein
MARPGFRNHRKFRRLVQLLAMPEPHVFGHVEFLWSVGYESGDPYLGDATDVELAAGWNGEAGALCRALLDCGGVGKPGLIEPVEGNADQFQIHDLYDHAPDYVQRRMERETRRTVAGKTLSDVRSAAAKKRWSNGKEVMQPDANDGRLYANGATPAPAPAPALNTNTPIPGGVTVAEKRTALKSADPLPGFLTFWSTWPSHHRKKGRSKCARLWIRKNLEPLTETIVSAVNRFTNSPDWRKNDGQFIPGPEPWLNDESWEALQDASPRTNARPQPAKRLVTLGET